VSGLPGVSVVVPTRGRPELVQRAVRAILDQAYEGEVECVVVFDGENPGLPEIATAAGRSLVVVENRRAAGAAGARNTGAEIGRGELVAFCDDDDEWLPRKLERQVALLHGIRGPAVIGCGIVVARGARSRERLAPEHVGYDELLRRRVAELHMSTLLLRRHDFLETIGAFDEQMPGSFGEDYEWSLRAARSAEIRTVREPLVRIHWHGSSWFTTQWQTMIAALKYLLRENGDFGRDPAALARIYGQIAFAYAALGDRSSSRTWVRRTLGLDWREPRGYLALLVSSRLLPAEAAVRAANFFGRGI